MGNSTISWLDFERSLRYHLTTTFGFEKLKRELPDACWTKFYKRELFPKIAEDLGLHYDGKELLTVDAIFYKIDKPTRWPIPIVLIESENDFETAFPSYNYNSEVYKLCILNAPLKVILTYKDEWNADLKNKFIDDEFKITIDLFHKYIRLIGEFVIVIAQCIEDKFIFRPFYCNQNGNIIEKVAIEILI